MIMEMTLERAVVLISFVFPLVQEINIFRKNFSSLTFLNLLMERLTTLYRCPSLLGNRLAVGMLSGLLPSKDIMQM